MSARGVPSTLPAGMVLEIAEAAGLELWGCGAKRKLRCPFHDDHRPSAFLSVDRNVFGCAVCGSLSAKRFAERLGVPWPPPSLGIDWRTRRKSLARSPGPPPGPRAPCGEERARFAPEAAARTWALALERARGDRHVEADRAVYRYLAGRGLSLAWDEGALGVLHEDLTPRLPEPVRSWPRRSYRILAPLHDQDGEVVEVGARAIEGGREPKVLYPRGARVKGTFFASRAGRELLAGAQGPLCVILGEGLTDLLALSASSPIPALSLPGAALAPEKLGRWARGRVAILALDCDPAGERHVPELARGVSEAGGRAIRLRWPRDAKDACEVLERCGPEGLGDFLAAVVTRAERGTA